jgi:hypothetical protein
MLTQGFTLVKMKLPSWELVHELLASFKIYCLFDGFHDNGMYSIVVILDTPICDADVRRLCEGRYGTWVQQFPCNRAGMLRARDRVEELRWEEAASNLVAMGWADPPLDSDEE